MNEPAKNEATPRTGADVLVEYLRTHEAACPVCGYNLHQLTSALCPECGKQLELRVGAVGLRIGALCACMAPMLMASGVAILFIIMSLRFGPPPAREIWVWAIMGWGLIGGVLALRLYSRRMWFLGLRDSVQNRLVLASWGVNFVILGMTVAFSR